MLLLVLFLPFLFFFKKRKGRNKTTPLAIIFMDNLEQRMLHTAKLKPEFFDRYVDDCLFAWIHGEDELQRFITHCKEQHPNIQFTWETSIGHKPVNYMDMSVSITPDNKIEYQLYQKQSDRGVNLNFGSCVPDFMKMAVATQQFRRASMLSSNAEGKQEGFEKIERLLRENDYPEEAIEKARKQSENPPKQREQESTVLLRLPFASDKLHKRLAKEVKKLDFSPHVRIVYKQGASLKNHLVRSAFVPSKCKVHEKFKEQQQAVKRSRGKPRDDCISCQAGLDPALCDSQGAVYSIRCKFCDEEYIGETKRTVRARIGEHHAQARNRIKGSAWGDHMRRCHEEINICKVPAFHNATLVARPKYEVTRKVREAVEIRERKPLVNNSKGWELS